MAGEEGLRRVRYLGLRNEPGVGVREEDKSCLGQWWAEDRVVTLDVHPERWKVQHVTSLQVREEPDRHLPACASCRPEQPTGTPRR